jgi:hypothetical protein
MVWHDPHPHIQRKRKTKQNDLNNWRDICLKEMNAKLVSSIIAKRLITFLDVSNVSEQFATIGCK